MFENSENMKLSKVEAARHKTKTQELVIYDILNEDGDIVGVAEELAHTEHPSAVMVTYRQETRGDFFLLCRSDKRAGSQGSGKGRQVGGDVRCTG